jgi:phage portal protein BeeE
VIDSEAESTTIALNPYLTMLKSIVKIYRKYLPSNERAERLARFLNALDENEWKKLVDNIPRENIGREVADFEYDFLPPKTP